jgi:hypothetical protein
VSPCHHAERPRPPSRRVRAVVVRGQASAVAALRNKQAGPAHLRCPECGAHDCGPSSLNALQAYRERVADDDP